MNCDEELMSSKSRKDEALMHIKYFYKKAAVIKIFKKLLYELKQMNQEKHLLAYAAFSFPLKLEFGCRNDGFIVKNHWDLLLSSLRRIIISKAM